MSREKDTFDFDASDTAIAVTWALVVVSFVIYYICS